MPKPNRTPRQPHPILVVIKVFTEAYVSELKSRKTLGYMVKAELANTAKALAAGIKALEEHKPDQALQEIQAEARAQSSRNGNH